MRAMAERCEIRFKLVYVNKDPKEIEKIVEKKWKEEKENWQIANAVSHVMEILAQTTDDECYHKVVIAKHDDNTAFIAFTDCPQYPITANAIFYYSPGVLRIYYFDEYMSR